jgi:hypothetical protein
MQCDSFLSRFMISIYFGSDVLLAFSQNSLGCGFSSKSGLKPGKLLSWLC